jgi:hypothetical protein
MRKEPEQLELPLESTETFTVAVRGLEIKFKRVPQ